MKLSAQVSGLNFPEQTQRTEVTVKSNTGSVSSKYANENNIQKIDQKNIIDGYFKVFDGNLIEIEIKNLIAARLQPAYKLPQVHDIKALSLKAKELLNISFTI